MSRMWAGRLVAIAALCVVLCLGTPAMAATWVVNPDGTGDFTTIQAALDSGWTSGDTIEIAYAVYKEPVAVDAGGCDLTITGIPSPEGDLPVIDGMDGTIELPGLVGGYGCGACAMYLFNGNFVVSSLEVTNASKNGLVVGSSTDGMTLQITNVGATENGRHGINIYGYDEVVLSEIVASDNERRGVNVWLNEFSTVTITDMYVMDNGWDGLLVGGEGSVMADISRVESTGNGEDGVVLNGLADFTVSDVLSNENGGGVLDSSIEESIGIELGVMNDLRYEGNGLFVVKCVNGSIDGLEATDNAAMGIAMDMTGDVTISDCTADGNEYMGILALSTPANFTMPFELDSVTAESGDTTAVLDTAFTAMTATVADAAVVSEDEFVLGENLTIFVEDIIADGPDVVISSVSAENNGYAGIGVLAPYVTATDITADGNGVCPTDVGGTISGAGFVGASFVGEYSGIAAADNGGAGIAAAALALDLEDSTVTGNGAGGVSETHGSMFQSGLVAISLVNDISGVYANNNEGSGILMTSVISGCDGITANGNAYGGIVAADPVSLGIAALLVHSGYLDSVDMDELSEADRFYLESLSTPAMQDVLACYGTTDVAIPSSVAEMDGVSLSEEQIAFLVDVLHQYLAMAEFSFTDSAADENGLFGLAVVSPNVATDGFSADDNGDGEGSFLETILGTGIIGLYVNGTIADTSVSDNAGAGMVTVGVTSEYTDVTADENGYAGIVTIDPLTLAAAAIGAYVVLDDSGDVVDMDAVSSPDADALTMHADLAESAVAQEIVTTYFTGTGGAVNVDQAVSGDLLEVLLDHIEYYFTYAGVYVDGVSASGNGYPGFVAIAPNVVMCDVTADNNGMLNYYTEPAAVSADSDGISVISIAAGTGIIGLSIVGDYEDIAATGNTGAGIATAGVVTDMAACEADGNGAGVVSLFVAGDHAEISADENIVSGIVLVGINGTLTDSDADSNLGLGIACVDPVAAAVMYFTISPEVGKEVDEAAVPSPEAMALVSQLSGPQDTFDSVTPQDETAWTLIEWAIEHISSYDGNVTELNESEIIELVLTHYLTSADLSVSDVSADENGYGIVVLSPSMTVTDVSADGNEYFGVTLVSPWKAVDAMGFEHPAEPVGDERIMAEGIVTDENSFGGLFVYGANGGCIMDASDSESFYGLFLSDSDNLTICDGAWNEGSLLSVICTGQTNPFSPVGGLLSVDTAGDMTGYDTGTFTDQTGSCNNLFVGSNVGSAIAVLPNSTGNEFEGTFFDEAELIGADITSDGPFVVFSTSGEELPEPQFRYHPGGCGMAILGLFESNATVNITYDYGYGFPPITGAGLYPQWTELDNDSWSPWSSWEFNAVTNDPVEMTVGPIVVPLSSPAIDAGAAVPNVISLAPFWYETPGGSGGGPEIDPNSGTGTPGDQQAGTPDAGGDNDGVSPVPAAGQDGDDDGSGIPAAMTPAPANGADAPAGSSPEDLPAGAGASENGGFLPWIVLIVVLVAIAGAVYYMKFQQK